LIGSELRYRRLFESAKDGILILDSDTGQIEDVNPFLVKLLGYSREQFLSKAVWDIGFFKDIIANRDTFLQLKERKYVRYEDLPLETADGQKIDVEFVSNVYQEGRHSVIQCNIRDITVRKRAEKALGKLADELRLSNKDLREFNDIMVGRELRMVELKEEVNALCQQFGLPPRYGDGASRITKAEQTVDDGGIGSNKEK